MKTYRTLKSSSTGFYKEKGSKFHAFAFPVKDVDEILINLQDIRTKYHDARHHCYAYIVGESSEVMKSNDDGEPSHSAGDPILGQLRSNELTNALIVVIRYFGGTKLGVGGLINAYKSASNDAISNNIIVEIPVTRKIQIYYPYESTSEIMRLVDEFSIQIKDQKFEESCYIAGEIPLEYIEEIKNKSSTLKKMGLSCRIEFENEK